MKIRLVGKTPKGMSSKEFANSIKHLCFQEDFTYLHELEYNRKTNTYDKIVVEKFIKIVRRPRRVKVIIKNVEDIPPSQLTLFVQRLHELGFKDKRV